ncbi:MAG: hypothetical protein AAGF72_14400 [Pseudomonadota bacterium]
MTLIRSFGLLLLVSLSACSTAPLGSDVEDSQIPAVTPYVGDGCGDPLSARSVQEIRASGAYERGGLDAALKLVVARVGPFVTDSRGPFTLVATQPAPLVIDPRGSRGTAKRQDYSALASEAGCDLVIILRSGQDTSRGASYWVYGLILGRTIKDG